MGFQTPQYSLGKYLEWTTSGKIQLPDFQRGYKWDDERIRQLLVTVVSGHPMGIVLLLKSSNAQVRFKPKPLEGSGVGAGVDPDLLLLDGQQRLTSLIQSLTGAGVVATKDARGKLMDRRYYLHIETALDGGDRIDEAVISVPGDGKVRSNFGKNIDLDLSTEALEQTGGYFPIRLLLDPVEGTSWLFSYPDKGEAQSFLADVFQPAQAYTIPAIELDETTTKAAVTTVFEKVNIGGLPLNAFELLTATFAGDAAYYAAHGTDFRLNDDWQKTKEVLAPYAVLGGLQNTDFLQAVSLLATLKRAKSSTSGKPPAVSARREDILKLSLDDYLSWVDPLREALVWASTFLADHYIFDTRFLPYAKQLVPLAAIRVELGSDADLHSVRARLAQWFWCGILGELYGGSIETRFARDIEQVPDWASGASTAVPRTVQDFAFVASRLLSLRTRNAAAYKGVYALILAQGARDWMFDKALDKVQYLTLAVDIHHVFPHKWCLDKKIEPALRESIVNKTPLSAETNRKIGGVAPSKYLAVIETKSGLTSNALDDLLGSHAINPDALRADDFDAHFKSRLAELVMMIEKATGKQVQDDITSEAPQEAPDMFDPEDVAVIPDSDDVEN